MRNIELFPESGQVYRHFKGMAKIYRVLKVTDNFVFYKHLYEIEKHPEGSVVWLRTIDEFLEPVETTRANGAKIIVPRFRLLG